MNVKWPHRIRFDRLVSSCGGHGTLAWEARLQEVSHRVGVRVPLRVMPCPHPTRALCFLIHLDVNRSIPIPHAFSTMLD